MLFAGSTGRGTGYVPGQAWERGATTANTVAYAEGGTNGPSVFVGSPTPRTAPVLAFVLDSLPGTSVDLLVVVPEPRTTLVLYDAGATGGFRPVKSTPGLDGVVLVDRDRRAGADRLRLLSGNGDPAKDVTFEGSVSALLCGLNECG